MITPEPLVAIRPDKAPDIQKFNWIVLAGVALLSLIYFADISLKASQKCFWYDELFTVYLCRLPTFAATWSAVTHGADFNPPLFYLLTRIAQRLFGEGLIATRLPAMVGVWLFCLCLFHFVARRAGIFSGLIAGLFPFFTLAQFYAYEARAHGIVMGWCGLALVCWQRNSEGRGRYFWLAAFGLSLLGALLTHVYAVFLLVPFAVVELYNLMHKPNWGNCAVMALVFATVTLEVYLPLSRVYRQTMSASFFAASHDLFQRFLTNVIGPALVVVLLSVVLAAIAGRAGRRPSTVGSAIPLQEMLLAAGFVCIPLVGILASKITHGPVIDRYFLSSIAGYSIFLGFANSSNHVGRSTARALAGCMVLLMLFDLAATTYLAKRHTIVLIEPSAPLRLTTTPNDPMALYSTLPGSDGALDILVPSQLEYIYFFEYAPPSLMSHIYYAGAADNIFFAAYARLAREAHIALQITPYEPFLANHHRFLFYESGGSHADGAAAIARAGYCLKSARSDVSGTLYEYEK